jgi:hypothetical protein
MSFSSNRLQGAEGTGMVHPGQLSFTGTGSGLDADLLDGNEASAFYLASNPSGYITTESDTLSSVTGRGNTTTTDISIANLILNNADNRTINVEARTGTNIAGRNLNISSGLGAGTGTRSQISFSTPNSTGRPCVSQPALRFT